jgi:hypothetical protein
MNVHRDRKQPRVSHAEQSEASTTMGASDVRELGSFAARRMTGRVGIFRFQEGGA